MVQIKNSISYYTEHQNEGIFFVHKFQPNPRYLPATINYENYDIVKKKKQLIELWLMGISAEGVAHK